MGQGNGNTNATRTSETSDDNSSTQQFNAKPE